jgi:hypothetical protein
MLQDSVAERAGSAGDEQGLAFEPQLAAIRTGALFEPVPTNSEGRNQ